MSPARQVAPPDLCPLSHLVGIRLLTRTVIMPITVQPRRQCRVAFPLMRKPCWGWRFWLWRRSHSGRLSMRVV